MIDYYTNFRYDLEVQADLTAYQTDEVIKFLENNGIKVYEILVELYGVEDC